MAILREQSADFLDYLETWQAGLPSLPLDSLLAEAGEPERVGLFCVDLINGFCHEGPLSSERVRSIITPIVSLFTKAHAAGIRHFVLTHDAHTPGAVEFRDYPPHCIRITSEAEIVPELNELPFASDFVLLPKNSLHSAIGTGLDDWLDEHPEVTHPIVVGNCTDLCTYQLAMHLKLRANADDRHHTVLLPVDCVDTYDVPVSVARQNSIPAHPADLLHTVFLYNMACNGVRVVQQIA